VVKMYGFFRNISSRIRVPKMKPKIKPNINGVSIRNILITGRIIVQNAAISKISVIANRNLFFMVVKKLKSE